MSGAGAGSTITHEMTRRGTGRPRPGLMIVSEACAPVHRVIFFEGAPLHVGRQGAIRLNDPKMSSDHATFEFLGGGLWRITDRGSKNGTFVNGAFIKARSIDAEGCVVVRLGASHLLLEADLDRYSANFLSEDAEHVVGAAVAIAHDDLGRAAREGANALIVAETGAGKELAAKVYHQRSRNGHGPFVAHNCAALADGLADAQLFGARKGAGTGVVAQVGWFESAHGGTLFLDELGELALINQAKLLRVLQEREVMPLGANKPVAVDFRLVSATNRDLEKMVDAGQFREDLYARIAQQVVRLPPLHQRREEIPYLVAMELGPRGLRAEPEFLEACLLHRWRRNMRELRDVVRAAARAATRAGVVTVEDLPVAYRAGGTVAPAALEEVPRHVLEDEEYVAPTNPKWPEVKRFYEQYGDAKKASQLAGVPVATGSRWIKEWLRGRKR